MPKFTLEHNKSNMVSENSLPTRPYSIFKNVVQINLTNWKVIGFPKVQDDLITVNPHFDIKVPSNVQYIGLDYFQYTNHTYPFPYNPPHIDIDNPVYVYTTTYDVKTMQKRHILNFEGVDSCFYLYINKEYVGYSSISHRHVEFDITPFVKEGKNEVRVIVFKWNFNSYLEDQDKIRLTGIFRDVYVLLRTEDYVSDYTITTDYDGTKGYINISAPQHVELRLIDKDKIIHQETLNSKTQIVINNPKLWNAENPYLYRLEIEYNGEIIEESVGIRRFEVKDGVLLLNNTKIKLKGINRHSFTENGYAETKEELERDIKILKVMNINALRTAHYPPHPLLPYLCDEYGLYLMVEADLESHGSTMASGKYTLSDYSLVSQMPEYYDQIIARNLIAYQSVKNRPSLFSFSLGNEAGWSKALIDVTDLLHNIAPQLLIHYETVWHSNNKEDYYNNNLDFYSRMYADLAWCEEHLKKHIDKPLILCEYTHSMGNSIGDAQDYQNLIEKYDNFAGGFVWEFISQSVRYKNIDLYGGDFGESQHDGNFCVDGVVEIDRTFTPQFHDLKEVFSPIGFLKENNDLIVINKFDFKSLEGLQYTLIGVGFEGEKLLKEGLFDDVAPKSKVTIFKDNGDFISYRFTVNDGEHVISTKQIVNRYVLPKTQGVLPSRVIIKKGLIDTMVINKTVFRNMQIHMYRPPIDNEMLYLEKYEEVGIKDAFFIFIKSKNDIKYFNIVAKGKTIGTLEIEYVLTYNFSIKIKATLNHGLTMLARFGVSFDIDSEFVSYFGYGPHESYIDRHQGSTLGYYPLNIKDNYRYIKPQASGNRYGVYYVEVDDILISSDKPFETSFDNIDIYTYPSHRHLLVESDKKTLYLDYKQSGVGSYACGPELQPKYRLNEKEIEFTLEFKRK